MAMASLSALWAKYKVCPQTSALYPRCPHYGNPKIGKAVWGVASGSVVSDLHFSCS